MARLERSLRHQFWLQIGMIIDGLQIFDAMEQMQDLAAASSENAKRCRVPKPCPVQSHKHSSEGFAVDWSRAAAGKLASGDNHARIQVWEPTSSSGAAWAVSSIYKVSMSAAFATPLHSSRSK